MQDYHAPHETSDPTPSAAGGVRDGRESEAKGDLDPVSNVETSNREAAHRSLVEDHCQTHVGEVSYTQAPDSMDETSMGMVEEGPLLPVNPLQIAADYVPENLSGSGSKSISKPHQGGKAIGRQKGKKQRKGGSGKLPETRSLPSQPVKPYDNFADQSSEENENRSSTKDQAKRTSAAVNDPSTARRQPQRSDGERFQGTPSRRLAFAPVPPSELNIRMGTTPNQTPEKFTPTKTLATSNSVTLVQAASTTPVDEELVSPILSLQRTGSITPQVLTIEVVSEPESDYVEENVSVSAITQYDEGDTIEAALERQSMQIYGHSDSSEHHDSDKENVPVHVRFLPGLDGMTWNLPQSFHTTRSCVREPLQTLYSAPSPSVYQSPDVFTTPTTSRKLARFQMEAGRQWQMVVDTNCLLNAESLESLKVLEGIRETRLVIPNIVVRELDYLQKHDDCMARASSALQWIEACMLRLPSWIHVQNSGEIVHVAMSPPVSPSLYRGLHSYVCESAMMHPLHDHVLECALFQQTMPDGRVAILTDDTTLKIKALAESLVVDTAVNFSDSLLNPYSSRFIYVNSTPIGRLPISRLQENSYDGLSTPGKTISSSKWTTPMFRPDTPRPTSRAHFSLWRKSQPLGLQALLQ